MLCILLQTSTYIPTKLFIYLPTYLQTPPLPNALHTCYAFFFTHLPTYLQSYLFTYLPTYLTTYTTTTYIVYWVNIIIIIIYEQKPSFEIPLVHLFLTHTKRRRRRKKKKNQKNSFDISTPHAVSVRFWWVIQLFTLVR